MIVLEWYIFLEKQRKIKKSQIIYNPQCFKNYSENKWAQQSTENDWKKFKILVEKMDYFLFFYLFTFVVDQTSKAICLKCIKCIKKV